MSKLRQTERQTEKTENLTTIKEQLIERRSKKEKMVFEWLKTTCFNNEDNLFRPENPFIQTNLPKQFIGWDNLINSVASKNGLSVDLIIDHEDFCYSNYVNDDSDYHGDHDKCENTCTYSCKIYMDS